MAAWNVVRGGFYSPSCLVENAPGAVNFWMANQFCSSSFQRFIFETKLEKVRQDEFPNSVSRLRGFFVFGDEKSALSVNAETWGKRFNSENLTDLGVSANAYSKLDSNWISELLDAHNTNDANWVNLARQYWSGKSHSKNPIWEYIVEGYATVWGLDLKKRALESISEYWPKSIALFNYCANAFSVGSNDGMTIPYITNQKNALNLDYYLRMVDYQNKEFRDQVFGLLSSADQKAFRVAPHDSEICLPDFTLYSVKRNIENEHINWP